MQALPGAALVGLDISIFQYLNIQTLAGVGRAPPRRVRGKTRHACRVSVGVGSGNPLPRKVGWSDPNLTLHPPSSTSCTGTLYGSGSQGASDDGTDLSARMAPGAVALHDAIVKRVKQLTQG